MGPGARPCAPPSGCPSVSRVTSGAQPKLSKAKPSKARRGQARQEQISRFFRRQPPPPPCKVTTPGPPGGGTIAIASRGYECNKQSDWPASSPRMACGASPTAKP
ncbi:hypothetical protein [Lysobacter gummosus]|uniref:hypothetical protein n=1 Tax=Lysobacter gummosus TaxID=262324 RepID=UPI0036325B28